MIQRDNGDRQNRKQARLKYTIDRLGIDWIKSEWEKLLGFKFGEAVPVKFNRNGDNYGWKKGIDGKWHLTYFVEGGRVRNSGNKNLKTALKEIAEISDGQFILTGNQNLIISGVSEKVKKQVDKILKNHNVSPEEISGLRKNSIACVALPTCPLAFAEAERYLPELVSKIENILAEFELLKKKL